MSDASWLNYIAFFGTVIIVVCLIYFSRALHNVVDRLEERVRQDDIKQKRLEATINRMETATQVVAGNLAETSEDLRVAAEQRGALVTTLDRMEEASHVVADNLANSVSRADATEGPDGAAADAALRTGDTAEAITKRQDDERTS